MNLQQLSKALNENGLFTHYLQASAELPLDRVNVEFNLEGTSNHFFTQISPVNADLGEETDLELFQFFTPFPIPINSLKVEQLFQVLPNYNELSILGSFNLKEEEHIFYHKYTSLVAPNNAGFQMIIQTTWLIQFLIHNLGEELLEVIA